MSDQVRPDPQKGPNTIAPVGRTEASQAKATAMVEALPWLQRFHGKTLVVKYGGNAMTDDMLRRAFAEDVVFLRYCGIDVVVVHGGGPQINAHLEKVGVRSVFAGGLRVTTPEAMEIVRMVLVGQVNREVVGLINDHGPFAVGLSGEDANLIVARQRDVMVEGEAVDLGRVGDVVRVDPAAITSLLADHRIPVIATIARAEDGGVYNVNADAAAGALAAELGAEKFIVLTDVPGLYADWPDTSQVLSEISATDLAVLMPGLSAGMIPKMQSCLDAVRSGVASAHVLDGRVPHALLLEVFTDSGVGTMVTP